MDTIAVLEGSFIERKFCLMKIKKKFTDCELFYFDKDDHYNYVSQMVTEISCFNQRRLFIIKSLPKVEASTLAQARTKVLNYFKKLLPQIPTGNIVIFDGIGISAESFFKEVRKYGKIYKFPQRINKSDAIEKTTQYFRKRKIELDHEIKTLLIDSLNPDGKDVDIDKLYLLIKKFYIYTYDKKKIIEKDVYAICSSKEFIIWTLYNFLDNKKHSSSIRLVFNHINNVKDFRYEASFFIQGMMWRYGLLLIAKNGVNNKMFQKEIRGNISNIKKLVCKGRSQKMRMQIKEKDNKQIQEYSAAMVNSVLEGRYGKKVLTYYTYNDLLLIYSVLSRALTKIRTGCSKFEINNIMWVIILTICKELGKKDILDSILAHRKELNEMRY